MVGRAAYHSPSDILCAADARIYGGDGITDPHEVVLQMLPYIDRHIAQGRKRPSGGMVGGSTGRKRICRSGHKSSGHVIACPFDIMGCKRIEGSNGDTPHAGPVHGPPRRTIGIQLAQKVLRGFLTL